MRPVHWRRTLASGIDPSWRAGAIGARDRDFGTRVPSTARIEPIFPGGDGTAALPERRFDPVAAAPDENPYNYTPQVMPALADVAHLAVGAAHACAVTWDDHLLLLG